MTKFNVVVANDDNTFSVVNGKPVSVKKISATRFSKVLGCNHWGDEFQAWCEIMKVAEPPFDGNKYTAAGQIIEPKLIDFCKSIVSPYIVTPGEYYDKALPVGFDFFGDNDTFGGMWDALAFAVPNAHDGDGNIPIAVIECKTTSRPQDWEFGVPEHYKAQGLMYAYLLGVNDVWFPVAFLTPEDYANPQLFTCTDENTRVFHLRADTATITCEDGIVFNIGDAINFAKNWWETYVDNNVSPVYNVRKDKEYLDIIRTMDADDAPIDVHDLNALCDALYEVDVMLEQLKAQSGIDEWEDRKRAINKAISDLVKPVLVNDPDKDMLEAGHYKFTASVTRKVDYDKLIADGLYDKYVKEVPTFRTTMKKEGK